MYTSARITGQPAPGYSSGQAIAAMQAVADEVLPEGFGYEWTGTTYQEQKTGNMATYIFALSVVCVFLFMAALYESWIRPLVIILTVPLATFGAMVGLWLYDMPLDVFGQIGLVMLIGLETKNAILIVEFGVELMEKHGMSIIDSAKEAARQRLRPILMTSFAFVFGVLPMAQATGAGAYSRNSLGVVIAFGIAVSTVLGRFVIPIYYVLGERLRGSRPSSAPRGSPAPGSRRPRPRHPRGAAGPGAGLNPRRAGSAGFPRTGGRRESPDPSCGGRSMADASTPMMQWSRDDGVAVVEILAREIQGPEAAAVLGEQLGSLLRSGETRLLLDFGRTRVMSSTAFGTLLSFWKQVDAARGELRICSMDPPVRFGADILYLGRYIPIHDDRPSALAAFAPRPS